MYVRLTTLRGAQDSIDTAVAYIDTTARPAATAMAGNHGIAVLTDRVAGTVAIAAYWESAEALAASEGAVAKLRTSAADLAGGGEVSVEVYEVAYIKRWADPLVGGIARGLRFTVPPAQVDEAIAFYGDELVPDLDGIPGLRSIQLLVDRATGAAISVSGWDDGAAIEAAQPALTAAAEKAQGVIPGVTIVGAEQLELVSTSVPTS